MIGDCVKVIWAPKIVSNLVYCFHIRSISDEKIGDFGETEFGGKH